MGSRLNRMHEIRDGGKAMIKTQIGKPISILGVMAAAALGMILLWTPPPVQAGADPCAQYLKTADRDGDGFSDYDECNGITFAGTRGTFPGSNSTTTGRADRLDAGSRDLFVILVPATPSNFPDNPLEFVSNPQAQGGLGVTVHVISPAQADNTRQVSLQSTQKAVRVAESLDTSNPTLLGSTSSCGTPNGLDLTTIYTARIKNFVKSINPGAPQSLIDTYIKHTIAHEIGHSVGPLAPVYNSNYGGYHYKTGTKVILDQSVYYKGTTFYIGTTYTSADRAGTNLK